MNFFNDFKPLRNILRKLNIWDVLYELKKFQKNKQIVPEVIEFIYLNSIVYSIDYKSIKLKNPKNEWNKLLTQTNEFHTEIDGYWINKTVWGFLHKLALNQLKINSSNILLHMYRYYFIFSAPELVKHIEIKIGMSYHDFFICALWLYSVFDKKSYSIKKSYFLQQNHENTTLRIDNIHKTLNILSIDFSELKQILKSELSYDENTFITHSYEHIKKPIFESDQQLYCLFPDHLLNQFTAGMYYISEIYDNKHKLNNKFGESFENYIGVILNKNKNEKIKIIKELKYNKGQNKSSDWILEESQAIAFLECKTKRLQIESKKFEEIVESDINSMSDAVTQTYKIYKHYKEEKINSLKYDPNKTFIPVIITLEEWYAGVPYFYDKIKQQVQEKLKIEGINENFVDIFKFHITSISKFETDIQVIAKYGIKEFYEQKTSKELDLNNFKYEPYFTQEIEEIIIKPLENQFEK